MGYYGSHGVDDSLLFFFLILVLMFCNPSIFGCGDSCGCYEDDCNNGCRDNCGC